LAFFLERLSLRTTLLLAHGRSGIPPFLRALCAPCPTLVRRHLRVFCCCPLPDWKESYRVLLPLPCFSVAHARFSFPSLPGRSIPCPFQDLRGVLHRCRRSASLLLLSCSKLFFSCSSGRGVALTERPSSFEPRFYFIEAAIASLRRGLCFFERAGRSLIALFFFFTLAFVLRLPFRACARLPGFGKRDDRFFFFRGAACGFLPFFSDACRVPQPSSAPCKASKCGSFFFSRFLPPPAPRAPFFLPFLEARTTPDRTPGLLFFLNPLSSD